MNSYAVYFTAQLRGGFKRSDAIRSLGDTFALDLERVKDLLSSAPKVVKRGVAKPQAYKVIKALWQGGWHSELHHNGSKIYSTEDIQATTGAAAESLPLAKPAKAEEEGAARKSPSTPTRSERLLRLAATDQSCSVCIPDRWQAMGQLNRNACLQAGCNDSDSYLVIIPQLKVAINRQVSQQEYTEAVLESAVGWVEEGGIVAPATLESPVELAAVSGEIEGIVGENRVHYLISVYEGQDSFFACYLWSTADLFERQRPLFKALLASIRVH